MHKWKTAKLGDVCGVFAGQGAPQGAHNYSANGTPFIKAGDMIDLVQGADEASIQKVTDAVAKSHRLRLFPSGTVLFAKSGMSATKGHIYPLRSPAYVVNHLACLVPNDQQCSSRYLGYFFRKYSPATLIKDSGYPSISLTDISNVFIPLPPLKDQKRIADILDKAAELISLRKQQIEKLDLLVKSKFIDMFGDPVTNPKGWNVRRIFEVVHSDKNALKAGPFGSSLKKEFYVRSGFKIYGQEQVISGNPSFGDYYIDERKYNELQSCSVKEGDVLISLVGTYGKLLIIPHDFEPGIINPRLMKISFDLTLVNVVYFKCFFMTESLMFFLKGQTHGGTMGILNLGIVKNIKLPVPPLPLQTEFATFVKKVEEQKSQMQTGLEKLELNYKALMAEFFEGDERA